MKKNQKEVDIFFIKKVIYSLRKHKLLIFQKVLFRLFFVLKNKLDSVLYILFFDKEKLKLIFNNEYSFIDFSCGKLQWEGILVQRYKQLALQFSELGGLVFAGSLPHVDKVRYIKKINDNLFIVNPFIRPLLNDLMRLCKESGRPVLARVQSTDFSISLSQIDEWSNLGFTILYEYIDPFHEDISGPAPPSIYERHRHILRDEKVYVCATADSLLRELLEERKNAFLSPNGVDPFHWKKPDDHKVKKIIVNKDCETRLRRGLPVIGYHGALAKWINYELLDAIAKTGRFTILLIGTEYDDSLQKSRLLSRENVCFLGPLTYEDLPAFAAAYDLSIIPFTFTTFSDGVSPIKLFEYMAIEKPIVGTYSKELEKYRSCLTAKSIEEFIKKLDIALDLKNDASYLHTLRTECEMNTWKKRAQEILKNCHIDEVNSKR